MPTYKVESVTPVKALKWMETNIDNRNIAQTVVDRYAIDMENDDWEVAQPILFDEAGNLMDGQHRLLAVIKSGKTVEMVVGRGLPIGAKVVIDTGRRRQFAQILAWNGEKSVTALAASIRMSWLWQNEYLYTGKGYGSFSHNVGLAFLEKNPSIRQHVHHGTRLRKELGAPAPVATAFMHRIYQVSQPDAEDFMGQIFLQEGLHFGMPTYALISWLQGKQARTASSRPEPGIYLACFIKAWNAYIMGDTIELMSFRRGGVQKDTFPVLLDPQGDPFPMVNEVE